MKSNDDSRAKHKALGRLNDYFGFNLSENGRPSVLSVETFVV